MIYNPPFFSKCLIAHPSLEEVALALLLEKFEFSLSEKPIIWMMSGISSPHVDRESKAPALPMIVNLAN